MLAVLALKMVHNEEYDSAEYVYEISAGKLFRQVRTLNLPFHRWYKWLECKFLELREAFMIEKEPKDSELVKWNVEADKAIEVKENQQKKKGSLFSRFSKWRKDGKHDKELQRKKSTVKNDDDDPFS